jgi:hypothetical protein
MVANPVYITDILPEVVTKANAALQSNAAYVTATQGKTLNYVEGTKTQIIQQLNLIKSGKYPMVMLVLAEGTQEGDVSGYEKPLINGIYIATLSNNTSLPATKYTDNFKPILYPIYLELLEQLARHRNVVECHPDRITHKAWRYVADNTNETNTIFTDFLDILGIEQLNISIQQRFSNEHLLSI